MRQNLGTFNLKLFCTAVVMSGIIWSLGDSPAEAGFLKNSVRVGDRSRMAIVTIPKPGQKKLIHAPGETRRPVTRGETQAWFWKQQSAQIAAAGAHRWGSALETLRIRRSGGNVLFESGKMKELADRYETMIAAAARKHDVSELLLLAVIAVESAGNTRAVSPKGAEGLMQLIPATAKRFGVADSLDPAQNIGGGAAYLDWLLGYFRDDPILAIAGYNAGEGAIDRYQGVPPFSETRDYVVKVFDALAAAEQLCRAPADSPRRFCGWRSATRS